jgi:hypothetical protein
MNDDVLMIFFAGTGVNADRVANHSMIAQINTNYGLDTLYVSGFAGELICAKKNLNLQNKAYDVVDSAFPDVNRLMQRLRDITVVSRKNITLKQVPSRIAGEASLFTFVKKPQRVNHDDMIGLTGAINYDRNHYLTSYTNVILAGFSRGAICVPIMAHILMKRGLDPGNIDCVLLDPVPGNFSLTYNVLPVTTIAKTSVDHMAITPVNYVAVWYSGSEMIDKGAHVRSAPFRRLCYQNHKDTLMDRFIGNTKGHIYDVDDYEKILKIILLMRQNVGSTLKLELKTFDSLKCINPATIRSRSLDWNMDITPTLGEFLLKNSGPLLSRHNVFTLRYSLLTCQKHSSYKPIVTMLLIDLISRISRCTGSIADIFSTYDKSGRLKQLSDKLTKVIKLELVDAKFDFSTYLDEMIVILKHKRCIWGSTESDNTSSMQGLKHLFERGAFKHYERWLCE